MTRWFKYFIVICLFSSISENLKGATLNVPSTYSTIQGAVNAAASSGDTIQIAAGTYIEQVVIIDKSLDIVGAGQNNTTILSPDASNPLQQYFTYGGNRYWCVLMIDNQAAPTAQTVNVSNLTVDGNNQQDTSTLPAPSPGFYGSSDRFFAIGYHNAGGTVQTVHTTNTRQTNSFGELAGGGIENASNTGAVTFNVTNCLVDLYQRLGIDCRGAALTANISNSTITRGFFPTSMTTTAIPNGIQFSGSAKGSIINNTVEGNLSANANQQAAGLLPFGAGSNLLISGNTINNNDIGIAAFSCGANLTIQNNTLNFTITPTIANTFEGILVQDTDGLTTLTSNTMNNIPDINMDLSTTSGNPSLKLIGNNPDIDMNPRTGNGDQPFQLMDNQFIGSQTGMLVSGTTGSPSTGPVITMNGDSFSGTIGYYIQESVDPLTAPNDIWPSTATVYFDGLLSGHITYAEYQQILTKIFDKHNDPTLGLVLDFIPPVPPTLTQINPTSGPSSGGNTVTITGSSFISSDTQVFFGSTLATNIVVVSDTTITVTAPPGFGTVDVTVVTPFGTTPIDSADEYTYSSSATTTQVTTLPNPSKLHRAFIIKAKVSSGTTPTGRVVFKAKGKVIGSAQLNGTGIATIKTCLLPLGTTVITATYLGNADFLSSSGTTTHTVL